jgi:hypothetical protein
MTAGNSALQRRMLGSVGALEEALPEKECNPYLPG